ARQAVDDMYIEVTEKWFALDPRMKEARQRFLLKALRFYEEFAKEEDRDPDRRLEAAQAQCRVAKIYRMLGQHGDAEKAFPVALDALERLAGESPATPNYRAEWAGSLNDFGTLLADTGRLVDAEQAWRRASDLSQELSANFPDAPRYRRDLVMAQFNLAL